MPLAASNDNEFMMKLVSYDFNQSAVVKKYRLTCSLAVSMPASILVTLDLQDMHSRVGERGEGRASSLSYCSPGESI